MDRRDQGALGSAPTVQLTRSQPSFAKPTGTQLFVRLLWRFFFSSLVPMPQKRPRPASSVEENDGREDVPGEEGRVLLSEDDAERTLSDFRVPMEVEVAVAESSARRMPRIPQGVDFQRAGL